MEEIYVTNEQIRKGAMEFMNKELLSKMDGSSMETKFGKFPLAMLAISAAAGTFVGRIVKNIDQLKAAPILTTANIVKDGKIEIGDFCENLKVNCEMMPEMFFMEIYLFSKAYRYQFTPDDVDKLKEYIVNAK